VPTHEELGIAFAKYNQPLRDAVDDALDEVRRSGTFAGLQARWFSDQSRAK